MNVPSHLVSAKIAEHRARGALERPHTDEARCLAELDRILAALVRAPADDAPLLRARLARTERALAGVYDRMGQGVLADALFEDEPSDAYDC